MHAGSAKRHMAVKNILGDGWNWLRTIAMPVIVLALAALLVALPVSYEWVISFFGPIVLYTTWKSVTTIALVNVGLAAGSLVLWPVVKIIEKLCTRWSDTMRAIGLVGLMVLGLLAICLSATDKSTRCGPAGPKSPCADDY